MQEDPQAEGVAPHPEENPLKQIRTFQGDIAEALKHQNQSVVSIAAREHAKQEETGVAPAYADSPTPSDSHLWRTVLLILGTVILLGGGGYGGWYAYSQYQVKTALPTVYVPENQLLTPTTSFDLNVSSLDRSALLTAISTAVRKNLSSGAVEAIEVREGDGQNAPLATTEHFFVRYLETQAPASLIRSFNPLFYLGALGPNSSESATHPFVIVKLDSFENAFPGMLLWEATLSKDLLPLISPASDRANSNRFQDVTIQNKDARVLKDSQGSTVLLYSFYDNNFLIITDNEASLRTLVSDLNAQKVTR